VRTLEVIDTTDGPILVWLHPPNPDGSGTGEIVYDGRSRTRPPLPGLAPARWTAPPGHVRHRYSLGSWSNPDADPFADIPEAIRYMRHARPPTIPTAPILDPEPDYPVLTMIDGGGGWMAADGSWSWRRADGGELRFTPGPHSPAIALGAPQSDQRLGGAHPIHPALQAAREALQELVDWYDGRTAGTTPTEGSWIGHLVARARAALEVTPHAR
jgi:hypothetical protein